MEQNDSELWDDLISYSMDKPVFIRTLLQHVGSHVDPIDLIQRIPDGLQIPHLRDAIVKIMRDFRLQVYLGIFSCLKVNCEGLSC